MRPVGASHGKAQLVQPLAVVCERHQVRYGGMREGRTPDHEAGTTLRASRSISSILEGTGLSRCRNRPS